MNQLTVFNISAQFGGAHEVIHPVVLQDASHLVLIDCGYVGFLPQIEQALTESGFSARDLTHVYITHQDHDHMGALADLQEQLPPEQQEFGRAFCALLKRVQPVPVDVEVKDGDVLDWCGGCIVLATPGHTPGHTSLYLQEFQTLITGDAIALEDGTPVIANPQFTLNLEQAQESMQKLLEYGAKELICYHGGRWIPA